MSKEGGSSGPPGPKSERGPMPWYRRFPKDVVNAGIGLPFDERLTLAILVDLVHMYDGRLPDDPGYIAGLLGCSVRRWKTIREALISRGKIAANGGFISISHVDLELETSKFREKQAENCRRGNKDKGLGSPEGDTIST